MRARDNNKQKQKHTRTLGALKMASDYTCTDTHSRTSTHACDANRFETRIFHSDGGSTAHESALLAHSNPSLTFGLFHHFRNVSMAIGFFLVVGMCATAAFSAVPQCGGGSATLGRRQLTRCCLRPASASASVGWAGDLVRYARARERVAKTRTRYMYM